MLIYPDAWYPCSNTCSLVLSLPRYSSRAILKERLLSAITHCEEFGLA
uniref:HECT domain-containing protein n=1 Tax=Nothoprocta perdicaria TaxID=30464 RepID=A0A8C6ZLZ4_NOTPE